MTDRSQDQGMGDVDGNAQMSQAERDAYALQNSNLTISRAFIALFGDRKTPPGIDWERADRILKREMQPEIEKRLQDTLLDGVLSEVTCREQPELVARRRSQTMALAAVKTLTSGDARAETLNPQTPMIETYARKDIRGKLLILGTPGAGKTTALLSLAQQLVQEAIAQPKTVIPIIFELSAWRKDQQSLEAWLIEQLYQNFGGDPKKRIYEPWLEQQVLLPLLDGLDELGPVRQKLCTEKINQFAMHYPQVVVCCRVKEFRQAGVALSNLRGAVQLQPLSDPQIQNYLAQVEQSGLWQQIQAVAEMRRLLEPVEDPDDPEGEGDPGLLRIPLFIDLAARVYDSEQPLKDKADLFDRYIDRQLSLEIRESDRLRKEFKDRQWACKTLAQEPDWREVQQSLGWLAGQLQRQSLVELVIEQMQPSWLATPQAKRRYRLIVGLIVGLIGGLIGGLIFGLIVGLIGGLKQDLKVRSHPNQGIWNSLQSVFWTTVLFYPAGVILVMTGPVALRVAEKHDWIDLPGIFFRNSPQFLLPGLFMALLWGVFVGGGVACVQHVCLRFVLTQDSKIPWNYARFLNYCAERRLLHRIGGRYRFIHRELLDHFAHSQKCKTRN